MPTRRIQRLSTLGAAAALLLVVAPAGGATARNAFAESQMRCPRGSVAAVIGADRFCLRAGLACASRLDWQYQRYGSYCNRGRLTKPLPVFSRRVDVGGLRLAIWCVGTGRPTVVLESGSGWDDSAWYRVQPRVARTTRVCSYDRAGHDRSDSRRPPGPVPAGEVVDELHRLLAGAGIPPPYVLGGWSLGVVFNRLYAKRYPAEVVGLVSVDGTPWGLPGEAFPGAPLVDPFRGGPGSPDFFSMAEAVAALAASPDLGARPLAVLTAGVWPGEWLKWQRQLARLSTSAILVRADDAGHAIQLDAPDLTAEAFRQVIAAARAGVPLRGCSASRLPRLGGTCLDPTSPSLG
jgi:pimeloyl-ACP methyl ester carboxylesterase